MDAVRRSRGLIRFVWALVLAAVMTLVIVPSAHAAPPIRERFLASDFSFVFKAGEACAFAIEVEVRYTFGSETHFSDGRAVFTDHADFTLTNLETGASYNQQTEATFTEITVDGQILGVLNGRFFAGFVQGDQGPDGEVGKGGASYILVGHFEYTVDLKTGQLTSFRGDGQAIDLCQLLGP